jgi:hypothetical protein
MLMPMLWFPYDAHLAVLAVGIAWAARHYRKNTTVRRLEQLVAQDRALRL